MSNSIQLPKSWKTGWVLLIITASVISTQLGYMAPLALIVLYPLAQTISLAFLPNSSKPGLWLIHIPYWLIIISFGFSEKVVFLGMFFSSILGEFLLMFILKDAREWKWLLYNTCAMIVLVIGYEFLSSIKGGYMNDFMILLAIGVLFGLSALVSVMGIELDGEDKKRPLPEDNDLSNT